MADQTLSIAIVTGAFTLIAATAPQGITNIFRGRQAERRRREGEEAADRDAYIALLRAVLVLRTQVADLFYSRDNDVAGRLELVRKYAGEAETHAFSVGLRAPAPLNKIATELGSAAARQAESAENRGTVPQPPDFTVLDRCIADFKEEALKVGWRHKKPQQGRDH